jgi:hypothetical protein
MRALQSSLVRGLRIPRQIGHHMNLVPTQVVASKTIGIILAVFCLAAGIQTFRYWPATQQAVSFYQDQFGPAIALACYGKLANLNVAESPAVMEFLASKTSSLDCKVVPSALVDGGPLNVFQYQIQGFLVLYGIVWRVIGITWTISMYVGITFYVMLTLSVFLLARTLIAGPAALATTAVFLATDGHTALFIGALRDYSKAPFIVMLVTLAVLCTRWNGRRLLMLTAGSGLVTGIGLGFRSDISAFILFFPLILSLRMTFESKRIELLSALALYAIALYFVDVFVFHFSPGLGRNFYHWYVLGQMDPFINLANIGVSNGSYVMPSVYNDAFAYELIGFAAEARGVAQPPYGSLAYDNAGLHFLVGQLIGFPADVLVKAYGAAAQALFGVLKTEPILQQFVFLGCPAIVLATCGWRAGTLLLFIYGLAATTFIQFDYRHHFVYSFLGLVLICISIVKVVEVVAKRAYAQQPASAFSRMVNDTIRLLLFPFGLFGAFIILLVGARSYQTWNVRSIHSALDTLPGQEIAMTVLPEADNRALLTFPSDLLPKHSYLRISLQPENSDCFGTLDLEFIYKSAEPFHDFTHRLSVPAGTARLYSPVLWVPALNSFVGFRIPADKADCMRVASIDLVSLHGSVLPLIYFLNSAPALSVVPNRLAFESFVDRYIRSPSSPLRSR